MMITRRTNKALPVRHPIRLQPKHNALVNTMKTSNASTKATPAKAKKGTAPAAVTPTPAPAPAPAPAAAPAKTVGEHIVGKTKEGTIDLVVRRRTLTTESKVAMIKRLLCTPGETKNSIFNAALPLHKGSAQSLVNTINTTRADLRRLVGDQVVATGWKSDGKPYKIATASVARLRTPVIGQSQFSAGVVAAPAPVKKEKPASEVGHVPVTGLEAPAADPAEAAEEAAELEQMEQIVEAVNAAEQPDSDDDSDNDE